MTWHEPKEAEIESMLSLGDRRMGAAILEVWKRGGRFDAWSEHFSWERWTEALAAAGVPKSRHLRDKDLKETLPWDVVDAAIRKPFLVVEWKKALKEMDTDDCKWGHCYACGVPGNGEDTVLANPLPAGFGFGEKNFASDSDPDSDFLEGKRGGRGAGALPVAPALPAGASPSLPFEENLLPSSSFPLPSAYTEKAKGAAYRMKATPDLLPLRERRKVGGGAAAPVPESARTYRLAFEKLGDARYLSHRNTMDVLERALRASGAPVRYTEGYNPHLRLSMGPALPPGTSRTTALRRGRPRRALSAAHAAAVRNDRLPARANRGSSRLREELPEARRSRSSRAAVRRTKRVPLHAAVNGGRARRAPLAHGGADGHDAEGQVPRASTASPEDLHAVRTA